MCGTEGDRRREGGRENYTQDVSKRNLVSAKSCNLNITNYTKINILLFNTDPEAPGSIPGPTRFSEK
jgi:hypothetical protein